MGSIPTARVNKIMAGVVKWLTHQIVALACVGSIPITRLFLLIIGVSPSGKARDFDSLMRWFESSYPSYFAGVAELADALDSKSSVRKDVPVRPRPPVLLKFTEKTRFTSLVFLF